ncbi:MAG: recombination regulator RecX [Clostridia bacterium]|nr:recombination regulator RecX [Clostridia bacterium]
MIEIKGIRTADNGGSILIECEITPDGICGEQNGRGNAERRSLLLLPEQYRELKIRKGIITEEKFDEAQAASRICMAVRKGRYLLSFGANSSENLRRKLRQRGFSADESAKAAEIIESEGAIDERRDALREAELRVRRGEGRRLVIAHLRSKGYNDGAVRDAEAYLDKVDFAEICRKVIKKKYGSLPEDPDERRKCISALMRRGFTSWEIRDAGIDEVTDEE